MTGSALSLPSSCNPGSPLDQENKKTYADNVMEVDGSSPSSIDDVSRYSPHKPQQNLSDEDYYYCSHCNFAAHTPEDVRRHLWEVHPLLTRRKQHLMKSFMGSRKRPNSESSEDRRSPEVDDVTPSKKLSGSYHVMASSWKSEGESMEQVERRRSPGEMEQGDKISEGTALAMISGSLGGLPFLKSRSNTYPNSNQLHDAAMTSMPQRLLDTSVSFVESSETIQAHSENDVMIHHATSSPHDAAYGINALISAAFSMGRNPDEWKQKQHQIHPTVTSSLELQRKSHLRGGASGLFTSGEKTPPACVDHQNTIPIGLDAKPASMPPVHMLQCGILPQTFAGCFPATISNGAFLEGNQHIVNSPHFISPVLPAYLPGQFVPGLGLQLSNSQASQSLQYAIKPAAKSQPSKLSTLSDVATQILIEDSLQKTAVTQRKSDEPSLNISSTSLVRHYDSNSDLSPALQSHQISPLQCSRLVSTSRISVPADKTETNTRSQIFQRKEKSSLQQTKRALAVSPQQRHLDKKSLMDDERVRSLEEALRKVDCCDPNDRSSVLPFRCPDGKWRMVRTKRIGGAWLVQMPGSVSPAVYLASRNNEEKNGETLNQWLKDQLNSLGSTESAKTKHVSASSAHANRATREKPDLDYSLKPPLFSRFNPLPTPPMSAVVQSSAIRNLLLQKTALA